ncbi:MAG TPA: class I SAM-dependent methyltransferase [Terriglobia bacterium]|nr:class I SAM-dependent methyltransferase [Terriglobia bacterium]
MEHTRQSDLEEIERSRIDAQSITDDKLELTEQNFRKYVCPPADCREFLRYAFSVLGNPRGLEVLDYGCGAGENSVILAALGAKVSGIDLSPDLVEIAKRRLDRNGLEASFKVASAYETGFPDDSFDVAFGIAILHHLDIERAAREVYRVLKPGGSAIFAEPIRDLRILKWLRKVAPVRDSNVSPGEYPLNRVQINAFSSRFVRLTSRRTMSPWGRLFGRAGYNPAWLYRFDEWFIGNISKRFAVNEVFMLRKPWSATWKPTGRSRSAVAGTILPVRGD